MASYTRLLGQDTEVRVIRAGGVEESLTDVITFTATDDVTTIAQGYLGETTQRQISIFNGTKGSISLHIEAAAAMKFKQDVIDRARRKGTYTKINILSTMVYPAGETYRILFGDLQISNLKVDIARESLTTLSFDWVCESPTPLD